MGEPGAVSDARPAPPLSPADTGTSTFPEVNLRTYVRFGDETGVFFFSIDAASWLGSLAARLVFHLPYFRARIQLSDQQGGFRMVSSRRSRGSSTPADLTISYQPRGPLAAPPPGSLEHFLLERYASFAPASPRHLYRGPILHSDWQVQEADADLTAATLITAAGLAPPKNAVCHFSPGVDTHVCPIHRVSVTG